MKNFIVLFILFFTSALCIPQDTTGTVVILSNKIGSTVDSGENQILKLPISAQHLDRTILLQRSYDPAVGDDFVIKPDALPNRFRNFPRAHVLQNLRPLIDAYARIQGGAPNHSDSTSAIQNAASVKFGVSSGIMVGKVYRNNDNYIGFVLDLKGVGFDLGAFFLSSNPSIIINSQLNLFSATNIKPFLTAGYGPGIINFGGGAQFQFMRHFSGKLDYRIWYGG